MAAAVPERKKLSVKPNLWLFVILERTFSTFYVRRFDLLCWTFYVGRFMLDVIMFDLLCSTFLTFYIDVYVRRLCSTFNFRSFIFKVLCSTFYFRSFCVRLLCSTFYVRRFMFDLLCSTFYVRRFMFDVLCSFFMPDVLCFILAVG
jgi:hypothetical protein